MKKIFKLLMIVFVIVMFASTALASKTYVVYDKPNSNTYVIPHKFDGKSDICVLRQKANKLNPKFYDIYESNEEKERLLEKKFRGVKSWKDYKVYYGYHEEVFGSKNMYLNWKDAENTWGDEDFHPTKGYDNYFFEKIEKYSVK